MSEDTDRANPKPPSVDRLLLAWRRVNDHKMVQWSVAYVALAYAIQHGVTLTSEAFEWPHAVERISMLLLALGLPVVMTLAWYHGARASRRISGPELTIIAILLVMSSLLFFVFVRPSAEIAAGTAPAVQQAGIASGTPYPAQGSGISIAVLPFANLSGDTGQEFFSDGMTEEIGSALAKVPNLRMVGRTSAFQFKGQNKDLRAIGQALGATYLIEGSVRKAGEWVRVTAQLVKAGDGIGLWTDNYDRDLKDIFATQEDIASAIAGALRVPLGLKPGDTLVRNRTSDVESYDQYLRAKALVRGRGLKPLAEAAALLEQVVPAIPTMHPPGLCWRKPIFWRPITLPRRSVRQSMICAASRYLPCRGQRRRGGGRSSLMPILQTDIWSWPARRKRVGKCCSQTICTSKRSLWIPATPIPCTSTV
jgi:TolB-like protein